MNHEKYNDKECIYGDNGCLYVINQYKVNFNLERCTMRSENPFYNDCMVRDKNNTSNQTFKVLSGKNWKKKLK